MTKNGFVAEVTLSQCSIYVESRWLVCMLNIVPKVSSLPSLLPINLVKMEDIDFSNRPHVGHLIKESCLGASEPCLVWCWCIFCRLRYVFYLSRDPTKRLHWDVMHIYGWELFAACHHTEKFGDHRHSEEKCSEEKCFIKNVDLINISYHWKIWLDNH